ncbi:mechanosensitive ion channel family protein [Actimicrobium sp. CCC2.4]|uniref:mechanosensitive ion channel family protein n=1 Tax=Actimicrobium sp. CCC2.4 TaxID=3048606 RepID=UPI002AC8B99D|nr:mechanosensitive ion channel family protein [Actimicrobium sp. CCC2.4]MEB0134091.1 mechanosensitive ion channel family protein [Actimicrobium sp. CCC2.4]WPX31622.1 mechanosensitive ion channel family protein [Actimicrobium sp. CCC2.4]
MSVDFLQAWLLRVTRGDTMIALVLQIFIIVLLVVVTNFFLRRLLAGLEARTRLTDTPWDFALVSALRKPLTVLAWILGLAFVGHLIDAETDATLFELVAPARKIGVISCLTWFLLRLVQNVQDGVIAHRTARNQPSDRTTVDAVGKLLRVSVLITAALVMLQSLGFSISGVLAFGGVGGIAVGFAAKDLLANFFGGLMVYWDRPFEVGDWIRSPDKEIEGTVEDIGWRLTRIRTFDMRPLYVPNGLFNTIAVENASRMTNRRIYETVRVRLDDIDKVAAIVSDIKALLSANVEIDQNQPTIVNLLQFSVSSIDILVYTFTRTTEWIPFHEIKQDVMLQIAGIITRHRAELALPAHTVNLQDHRVAMSGPPVPVPG